MTRLPTRLTALRHSDTLVSDVKVTVVPAAASWVIMTTQHELDEVGTYRETWGTDSCFSACNSFYSRQRLTLPAGTPIQRDGGCSTPDIAFWTAFMPDHEEAHPNGFVHFVLRNRSDLVLQAARYEAQKVAHEAHLAEEAEDAMTEDR